MSTHSVRAKQHAFRDFLRPHPTVAALLAAAQSSSEMPDVILRIATFLPAGNDAPIQAYLSDARISTEQELKDGAPLAIYSRIESRIEGFLFKEDKSPAWFLISLIDSDDFRRLVGRVARRLHPWYMQPHLRTPDIKSLFDQVIRKTTVTGMRVTEYVARSLFSEGHELHVRTRRVWTDEPHDQVFQKVREDRSWLRSIHVRLLSRSAEGGASLTRSSVITVRSDFRFAYSEFVQQAMSSALERLDFFKNRSIEDSPGKKSRPLMIEFKDRVFEDKAELGRLAQVLRAFPRSSLSALHANPYFRASLLDYRDGSSYEIWVLSESRLVVVPKKRATAASIGDLSDHICDNFLEGTIGDFDLRGEAI